MCAMPKLIICHFLALFVSTSFSIAKPILTDTTRNKIVTLPDAESTVQTLLVCDIQPGALVQSYSVEWFRMIQSVLVVHEGEKGFELTLNVTSSLNGSQHLCVVTVNHDGNISRNYSGGIITIQGIYYIIHCKVYFNPSIVVSVAKKQC